MMFAFYKIWPQMFYKRKKVISHSLLFLFFFQQQRRQSDKKTHEYNPKQSETIRFVLTYLKDPKRIRKLSENNPKMSKYYEFDKSINQTIDQSNERRIKRLIDRLIGRSLWDHSGSLSDCFRRALFSWNKFKIQLVRAGAWPKPSIH